MMLFVILLSALMILLSILSVIRCLICGNNQYWLLNLNLIYKTLWRGSGLLISMLEKLDWFCMAGLIKLVLLIGKWIAVSEEKTSFKMLGFTFSSKLDQGSYIISIAKIASKNITALICSIKFLSPGVALYHMPMHRILLSFIVWWELLEKLQNRLCKTGGFEPLVHCRMKPA